MKTVDCCNHLKVLELYKKKCKNLNKVVRKLQSKKHFEEKMLERLKQNGMTTSQARTCITGNRSSRKYVGKDIVHAATLKCVSRKSFNHLQKIRIEG